MDFKVLKYALQAFKNLQQIRLMPLENENDRRWYRFLKRYHAPDAEDFSVSNFSMQFSVLMSCLDKLWVLAISWWDHRDIPEPAIHFLLMQC